MHVDYMLKVIALGNGGVGKTAITRRYASNKFEHEHKITIGVDITTKEIQIDNYIAQLTIWDTGGQEAFQELIPMYYKGALGALIIYDITDRKSFESVDYWINEVKRHCNPLIPVVILVANKQDLDEERKIKDEEGEKKAKELSKKMGKKVMFFRTSAKNGENINDLFETLTREILKEYEEENGE